MSADPGPAGIAEWVQAEADEVAATAPPVVVHRTATIDPAKIGEMDAGAAVQFGRQGAPNKASDLLPPELVAQVVDASAAV